MGDVVNMLESDHRRVEEMLATLAESEPGPERETTVQRLVAALTLHMHFEEQAIYPLMEQLDAEMAEEANVEHGLTREGLAKLQEMTAGPGFGAAVEMLAGGIGHHVNDEETEAFPELRKQLDKATLKDLGARLINEKRQSGLLEAELAGATKEQLLDLAREADIEGRSGMTTDELRAALT